MDSLVYELKDVAQEIGQENEALAYDPEEAERVKNRLSDIFTLQQKHKVTSVDIYLCKIEQLQSIVINILEYLARSISFF